MIRIILKKASWLNLIFIVSLLIVSCMRDDLAPQIDPETIEHKASLLNTAANDITIHGEYAYCSLSGGLKIYDLSRIEDIAEIGNIYIPAECFETCIIDNFALVAAGTNGLQVVDVSDPSRPTIAGRVELSGFAVDIATAPGLAWVACREGGIAILDISTLPDLSVIGKSEISGGAWDIDLFGDTLFVACADSGAAFLDVTRRDALKSIAATPLLNKSSVQGVKVVGKFAYAFYIHPGAGSIDPHWGLAKSDMADPDFPGSWELLSTVLYSLHDHSVRNPDVGVLSTKRSLTADNNMLYLAFGDKKVYGYELTSEGDLVGASESYDLGGENHCCEPYGNFVCTMPEGSLKVIDFMAEVNPYEVAVCQLYEKTPGRKQSYWRARISGEFECEGIVADVTASGGYAFVSVGGDGLLAFSTEKSPEFSWVGRNSGWAIGAIAGDGRFAYALEIDPDWLKGKPVFYPAGARAVRMETEGKIGFLPPLGKTIRSVEVIDDKAVIRVGTYRAQDPVTDLCTANGLLFVATITGIDVVDVHTRPERPSLVSRLEIEGGVSHLAWSNGGLCVAGSGGFGVFPVATNESLNGSLSYQRTNNISSRTVTAMSADGTCCCVAYSDSVLVMYNVQLGAPVEIVGTETIDTNVYDISMSDGFIWAACGEKGIEVFGLGPNKILRKYRTIELPNRAIACSASDGQLFVADGHSLVVFGQ